MFSLLKNVFGSDGRTKAPQPLIPTPTHVLDTDFNIGDVRVCIALETEKASHIFLFDSSADNSQVPRDGQLLKELMFGSSPMRKSDASPGWRNAETKIHVLSDPSDGEHRLLISKLFLPSTGIDTAEADDSDRTRTRRPSLGDRDIPFPKNIRPRPRPTPIAGLPRGTVVATSVGVKIGSSDTVRLFLLNHMPLIELRFNMLLSVVERCMIRLLDLSRITGPGPPPSSVSTTSGLDSVPVFTNASSLPQMALQDVKQLNEMVKFLSTSIHDLFVLPRLPRPLWLDMVLETAHIGEYDTSDFFVNIVKSTHVTNALVSAVTAVLACHHTWIHIAMSCAEEPQNTGVQGVVRQRVKTEDRHGAKTAFPGDWTDLHGVNPHHKWQTSSSSQFEELACGKQRLPVHTIILGRNKDEIDPILHIVSYFIRCREAIPQRHWANITHEFISHQKPQIFRETDVETSGIETISMPPIASFAAFPPQDREKETLYALRFSLPRSLFFATCPKYVNGSVLMGITSKFDDIISDVHNDLVFSAKHGQEFDEDDIELAPSSVFRGGVVICSAPRGDASRAIMVDIEQDNCDVLTCTNAVDGNTRIRPIPVRPSPAVRKTLVTLSKLHSLGMKPQAIIRHLENFLQELILRAKIILAARPTTPGVVLSAAALAPSIGIDVDDLPLILSIADALWRLGYA